MKIANALMRTKAFGDDSDLLHDPEALGSKNYQLLILHGGEDISPGIYGQEPVHTDAPETPSARDRIEMEFVREAWKRGIPILGCCRGAQLLCAMLGGTLYQHVTGHAGSDHVIEWTGEPTTDYKTFNLTPGYKFTTNSVHHQMMRPKDGKILAVSHKILSPVKFTDKDSVKSEEQEPEIVYWKDARSLAVQGHPEWNHGQLTPMVGGLINVLLKA